jgi:RNA-directed DNA polymerase
MCLRVAFLLITRLASWLRLSQREETWKTAEILILRHRKRGTSRYYACTYPSRKAVKAVTVKVKAICRRNASQPLQILIRQLNPEKRGWCAYFRPGVSAATFADQARYPLGRFLRWARRKHRRITVNPIRRRYSNL